MPSEVRGATRREGEDLAINFYNHVEETDRSLVQLIERSGFRVVYKIPKDNSRLSILTPSRKVLSWDFDIRSLDSLAGELPGAELDSAAIYLGIICQDYINKDIVS